jgi:DNA-binding transcriptional ArsR family regulator
MNHSHAKSVNAVKSSVANQAHIEDLSETFRVLGDPTRLKIVIVLAKTELCTLDISKVLDVSESAVSHQLRLLKTLRLVKQRKEGKMVFYSLDDEHIEDLIRVAARHVSEA